MTMDVLQIAGLTFVGIYCFFAIVLSFGLLKKYKKTNGDLPSVSIIVAARNEEASILSCMKSLSELDYPEDKLEIILVDDNSDDGAPPENESRVVLNRNL